MALRRLYYIVKPIIPWSLRMSMRRLLARYRRDKAKQIWPINEAAGAMPKGWPGWPDGKKFAFVVTHDVEGPQGFEKIQRLAEIDAAHGIRSSFNLVPEGLYRVTPEMRDWLVQRGFEVGVHDLHHNGKLYVSREEFLSQAKSINKYLREWQAVGFRGAFMLRNLEWIHALDLKYDASTFDTDPFEPQPDGIGSIFPFWKSSQLAAQHGIRTHLPGYVELPYSLAQDSTMFLLLREKNADIWTRKLDWVAAHGGMALINVHPDYVQFEGERPTARTFPVRHYSALLEHLKARHAGNYWQALPCEVAAYVEPLVASGQIEIRR